MNVVLLTDTVVDGSAAFVFGCEVEAFYIFTICRCLLVSKCVFKESSRHEFASKIIIISLVTNAFSFDIGRYCFIALWIYLIVNTLFAIFTCVVLLVGIFSLDTFVTR